MHDTSNLGLPLLQPAQAQKHVTLNAALSRLDGLVNIVLDGTDITDPPATPSGIWSIGTGATGAWFGRDGQLAIASNGGWEFVTPRQGWRAWSNPANASAVFDGHNWVLNASTVAASGAGLSFSTVEFDHVLSVAAVSTTANAIPAQSIVFGVTGRVLTEISGTLTSFSVGVDATSFDRYGSGFGLGQGSWLRGITSSPLTYYADTPLAFTAEAGEFSAGSIRISIHFALLRLPRA